uniref:Saposin B-type domain-containing protein n=1 Tax=Ditylenchus dipsaci TaxID=166011 RepID=A0A915DM44_9BILA
MTSFSHLFAFLAAFTCSVQLTSAIYIHHSVTHSLPENKPNDCKSCMFVLLKLAENYHKLNSSVEHPGQYISQALEGECLKHKFQKPEISCLTILEQVNRLNKTDRDALANPKYLNGKLSICTRSVKGCPKEYDLEKLLASGTEDRSIGDWFVNAANAVSTFFG